MAGYRMAVFGVLRNFPLIVFADRYLVQLKTMLQPFGTKNAYGKINPGGVLTLWQMVR